MVAGWPIADHVWAGDTVDHSTVQEVVRDLHERFRFNRIEFVGDRGMVTEENFDDLTVGKHRYVVGLKRRRNREMEQWISAVDQTKWIECLVGITARERTNPPRTRAQEVPSRTAGVRVIVVDSDDRRGYEEGMRQKSMTSTREQLQRLADRVAAGRLKRSEKIGAPAPARFPATSRLPSQFLGPAATRLPLF
jgi:transposase